MPSLLLHHTLYLFTPKPGRYLSEVRRQLAARPEVRVLWHGRLGDAGEWRARKWVAPQRNEQGGVLDPYRSYQTAQGSGERGYYSALESLYSAAVLLVERDVNPWDAEVVVARVHEKAPLGPTSRA
jgi:hypothetical protein